MNRRDALKALGVTAMGAGVCAFAPSLIRSYKGAGAEESGSGQARESDAKAQSDEPFPSRVRKEARHYRKGEDGSVHCQLCFHDCHIPRGAEGVCRNRVNTDGKLINVVYNKPSAVSVEPTEKEPMHHFLPGSDMLCIGTASCNFHCRFCHNWHLAHRSIHEVRRRVTRTPEHLVRLAKERQVPSVSFTYNEPTVFYEYMFDVAVKARKEGLRAIMHSNGGMSREALRELLPHIDAATIDLKAFSPSFYREMCSAKLEPVLDTLETIKNDGTWLEIVNLVLPGHNDDPGQVRKMCKWIHSTLGPDVPVHFSRFFPSYRLTNLTPTPISTLERCREIGREEGLHFISIGNAPGHEANSSYCPGCGARIIHRTHHAVSEINMKNGACGECQRAIPGIWE